MEEKNNLEFIEISSHDILTDYINQINDFDLKDKFDSHYANICFLVADYFNKKNNNHNKSIYYLKKGFRVSLKLYGKEHEDTINLCIEYGLLYWHRKKYKKALIILKKSLSLIEQSIDYCNFDTVMNLYMLSIGSCHLINNPKKASILFANFLDSSLRYDIDKKIDKDIVIVLASALYDKNFKESILDNYEFYDKNKLKNSLKRNTDNYRNLINKSFSYVRTVMNNTQRIILEWNEIVRDYIPIESIPNSKFVDDFYNYGTLGNVSLIYMIPINDTNKILFDLLAKCITMATSSKQEILNNYFLLDKSKKQNIINDLLDE